MRSSVSRVFGRLHPVSVAVGAACLYGVVLYVIGRFTQPASGLALHSFIWGVPAATCALAVWLSDPFGRRSSAANAGAGAIVITAMMLAAGPVLREGIVCVIMASPLFYAVGCLIAVVTGRLLRLRKDKRDIASAFCIAVLALPLVGIPLEDPSTQQARIVTVRTAVAVAAPPEAVWPHAVEVRAIASDELGFTLTQDVLGVPKPLDARLQGRGLGAVRHAEWTGGVRFREHVTEWSPGRRLAWTFEVPSETQCAVLDEHLDLESEYLRLLDGGYTLSPDGRGGTKLVLETRYRLRAPADRYLALWGRLFLGDIHTNVVRVVKGRAEADAPP